MQTGIELGIWRRHGERSFLEGYIVGWNSVSHCFLISRRLEFSSLFWVLVFRVRFLIDIGIATHPPEYQLGFSSLLIICSGCFLFCFLLVCCFSTYLTSQSDNILYTINYKELIWPFLLSFIPRSNPIALLLLPKSKPNSQLHFHLGFSNELYRTSSLVAHMIFDRLSYFSIRYIISFLFCSIS